MSGDDVRDDAPEPTTEIPAAPPAAASYEFSPQIDKLAAALAAAQGEFGEFERAQEARIESRKEGGRSYSYNYEDLADLLAATRPALAKNNLAITQFPAVIQRGVQVVTLVLHSSGQWLKSTLAMPCETSEPRAVGSGIAYARRYALKPILCVAPGKGEDDDAAAAAPRGNDDERVQPGRRASSGAGEPRGKVAKLTTTDGATVVILDSGYSASSRDPELVAALQSFKTKGTSVELRTKPSADPSRWLPTVLEISGVQE